MRFLKEVKGIDTRGLRQKLAKRKIVGIIHLFNILVVSALFSFYCLTEFTRWLNVHGRDLYNTRHVKQFNWKITGGENGVLVNGVFPGPEVHVNKGEFVIVNVENLYEEPVAVHFHGVANHMDRSIGCGIAPNASSSYFFRANDLGSHWYHAVSPFQKRHGLYGAFIVHDTNGGENHHSHDSGDRVVLLQDTFLQPIDKKDFLINGIGKFECSLTDNKRCQRYPEILLNVGHRNRLRIINTSTSTTYNISVDEHLMEVVETDGTIIESVKVHYLTIGPGQRYSIIIEAEERQTPVFLRAEAITEGITTHTTVKALLYFQPPWDIFNFKESMDRFRKLGTNSIPWTSRMHPSDVINFDDTLITPKISLSPPVHPADKKITFRLDQNDALETSATTIPNTAANIIHTRSGATVELVIVNYSDIPQHFHLHGQKFWLVETESNNNLTVYRDTITVQASGYSIIKWQAFNSGFWAFDHETTLTTVLIFAQGRNRLLELISPSQFPRLK